MFINVVRIEYMRTALRNLLGEDDDSEGCRNEAPHIRKRLLGC